MTTDLGSVALLTKRGTDLVTPVIGDDGPTAGLIVGSRREHWDGRVDAKAQIVAATLNPKLVVQRVEGSHLLLGATLNVPRRGLLRVPTREFALPDRDRLARRILRDRGAFGNSGLFYLTIRDMLQNDTAVDLLADTMKLALYTNSKTPNFDTDTAYNTTAEVSGTGYSAGGAAIANDTITVSSGTLIYDGDDVAWGPGATISSVRGGELYDDTITTPVADPLVMGVTFGADFAVTSGTLTVQWAAGGIFTIDLTP